MSEQTFDYVIVGGGLAGCVLASRLSQRRPDLTVALIEAGSDESSDERLKIPIMAKMLHGTHMDWNYSTTAQAGLGGRVLRQTAGKVLSGGAALNYGKSDCIASCNGSLLTYSSPRCLDAW